MGKEGGLNERIPPCGCFAFVFSYIPCSLSTIDAVIATGCAVGRPAARQARSGLSRRRPGEGFEVKFCCGRGRGRVRAWRVRVAWLGGLKNRGPGRPFASVRVSGLLCHAPCACRDVCVYARPSWVGVGVAMGPLAIPPASVWCFSYGSVDGVCAHARYACLGINTCHC